MRGEHKFAWIKSRRLEGSSPHARGALKKGEVELVAGGIIPACAGSTARLACGLCCLRDHPRMRGEHTSRPARLVNILA